MLARTADGRLAAAYALTGRSAASRARALRVLPGGDVAVEDTSGGARDALRHYTAVARRGPWLVVGNGDQVAPIADRLAADGDVVAAWAAHTYEPDGPLFTPRIWLAARGEEALLGRARRGAHAGGPPDRAAWLAPTLAPGDGLLLTTYDGTVADVRAAADPVAVSVRADDAGALLDAVWRALDPALRVAALAVLPALPDAPPVLFGAAAR